MNDGNMLSLRNKFSIHGIPVLAYMQSIRDGYELRLRIRFPDFTVDVSLYEHTTTVLSSTDAFKLFSNLPKSYLKKRIEQVKKYFSATLPDSLENQCLHIYDTHTDAKTS
jgi:hypothetical protein